jgi:hypothetical protein
MMPSAVKERRSFGGFLASRSGRGGFAWEIETQFAHRHGGRRGTLQP